MSGLRWMKYTLPSGRHVYLTQRPDRIDNDGSLELFLAEKAPCVRFNFCDDWVEPPVEGPPWHWHPWLMGRDLQVENVFAFMATFKRVDDRNFMNKPVWMHCDSSSCRAPTHLGLWLRANYTAAEMSKIVKSVEFQPEREEPNHPKASDGTFLFENPIDYSRWALERDPHIKGLIKSWRKGGEEAACGFINSIKDRRSE